MAACLMKVKRLLLVRRMWEWRYSSTTAHGGRAAGTHWMGDWVMLRTGLDAVQKRKVVHCRESNPAR
jgi:hypothetical protein